MDEPVPERIGCRWCLWAQRISLLILPAVTLLLSLAFIFIELFNTSPVVSWQNYQLFWLAVMYYGMPLPLMVLVVAWIRPYAGSILAFISVVLVIFYYTMLTYIMNWPDAEQKETILKIALLGIPEIVLLALGGIFGLIWKKSAAGR